MSKTCNEHPLLAALIEDARQWDGVMDEDSRDMWEQIDYLLDPVEAESLPSHVDEGLRAWRAFDALPEIWQSVYVLLGDLYRDHGTTAWWSKHDVMRDYPVVQGYHKLWFMVRRIWQNQSTKHLKGVLDRKRCHYRFRRAPLVEVQ